MAKGINEYKNGYDFYKDSETDQIWQVDNNGRIKIKTSGGARAAVKKV